MGKSGSSGEVKQRVTIREAAILAGVSIASVSRALNNKPGLNKDTRARILAICAQLEYVPNLSARHLSAGKSNAVAISMGPHNFIASRYISVLWPHLAAAFHEKGKVLFPLENYQDESALANINSAILLGVQENDYRLTLLKTKQVPFVCIGMVEQEFWVAPDDFNGSLQATTYLLDKGYRRIGFVTPTTKSASYKFRYQGYMSALAARELPIREIQTGGKPMAEIAAYRHFYHADAASIQLFDSFICECDETAIGLIAALQDRGYNVPDDIAVVGYDGIPRLADHLTTVVQQPVDIAQKVVELLEEALMGLPSRAALIPALLRIGQTA